MSNVFNFDELVDAWGAPIVARTQVAKFSGGLLNPRTMANLDSLGLGPEGKIMVGGKVAYITRGLVEWMRQRQRIAADENTAK